MTFHVARRLSVRDLIPRTLPAWVILLLVAVLLVSQTSLFAIMSRDRLASSEIVDLYRLSERAAWLTKLVSPFVGDERQKIVSEFTGSSAAVSLSSTPSVTSPSASVDTLAELEDILQARLSKFGVRDARVRLDEPRLPDSVPTARVIKSRDDNGGVEDDLSEVASDFRKSQRYTASIQLQDGEWLNFTTPVTPVPPLLSPDSLPTYIAVSLVVVAVAVWAVGRIAAPYHLLEAAVVRLGDDLNSPPLPESGNVDLRRAARALNETQKRLQESFEERELLAAALAHDLRTPMTRMRLRLALLRNSEMKRSLSADISGIEETVQSVIDLAAVGMNAEPSERIDLWSMVDAIADEYQAVTVLSGEDDALRPICFCPPVALRRIIRNLIDNAIKYGHHARLSIVSASGDVVLLIEDDGPGIPDSDLEKVFKPFVRLELSRNRETGGSGLGLTIARMLIRKMGGELMLSNGKNGGLMARLTIPRQPRSIESATTSRRSTTSSKNEH